MARMEAGTGKTAQKQATSYRAHGHRNSEPASWTHVKRNGPESTREAVKPVEGVKSLQVLIEKIAGVQYIKKGRACSQITQVRPPSISGVDSNSYSKRFVKFLECVFPEQD